MQWDALKEKKNKRDKVEGMKVWGGLGEGNYTLCTLPYIHVWNF